MNSLGHEAVSVAIDMNAVVGKVITWVGGALFYYVIFNWSMDVHDLRDARFKGKDEFGVAGDDFGVIVFVNFDP